ncbi:hypothetical protein [Chitinimonas lacunae]|uniref:Uncharacterized protein n=1 Tax=Chitinimonas lacunae TaxID=1963018 RepID=A0ABV8MUS6_9NEIS
MSSLGQVRSRWLFNRTVGVVLLWIVGIVGVAVLVNVIGVHVVGGIGAWADWLRHHALHFFTWRLCLYALVAYGWWWMGRRLRQRESAPDAHQRLLRVEIAVLTTVVLLESSQLLLQR